MGTIEEKKEEEEINTGRISNGEVGLGGFHPCKMHLCVKATLEGDPHFFPSTFMSKRGRKKIRKGNKL